MELVEALIHVANLSAFTVFSVLTITIMLLYTREYCYG